MPTLLVPVLIAADQILKLWAERHLDPIPDPFLPGLYLTFVKNTGIAFGLFKGSGATLGWLSLGVGALILAYLGFVRVPAGRAFALSLIAAGAIGNAIDRIGRGYVVDYLDIGPGLWPVFNLADALVVIGAGVLLVAGPRRR